MQSLPCPQGKSRLAQGLRPQDRCPDRAIEAHGKMQLNCSGDRGGCSRCLASSVECIYGPDGDGSTAGRSRLKRPAKRRRRRQTAAGPSAYSTADNDRCSTTSQHGRMRMDVNVATQMSTSAAPGSAKGTSPRPGSSSDAPPSTDWPSDWFDFNDFTHVNGEPPTFGLSSPTLHANGIPVNAVSGTMAAGPLPALSLPCWTSWRSA